MDGMYGVSSAIFSELYGYLFGGQEFAEDPQHQNMSGYFLLLGIGFGAVGLLAVIGLREYKAENEAEPDQLTMSPEKERERDIDTPGDPVLLNMNYQVWATYFT